MEDPNRALAMHAAAGDNLDVPYDGEPTEDEELEELQRLQERARRMGREAARAVTAASHGAQKPKAAGMRTATELKRCSKNELAREIGRLRHALELLRPAAERVKQLQPGGGFGQPGAALAQFQHAEAFMLMRYVSDDKSRELLIWNGRDGVTPFGLTVDGVHYTHAFGMTGPFFDRPAEAEFVWETRSAPAMMAAWHRALARGVMAGKLDRLKAQAVENDKALARGANLNIGLRSVATGRFADEEAQQ